MQRKVEAHWEETGGLCACFRVYEQRTEPGEVGPEVGEEGQGLGEDGNGNGQGQGQGRGTKYEVVDSGVRHVR